MAYLVCGGKLMQATQIKNPDVELLKKLAEEHLETLKLLAKNGNHRAD
jgi:hypothetical protein